MKKSTKANNAALKQERNIFADMIQDLASKKLIELGYDVLTHEVNNGFHHHDMLAQKDIQIKIEIKGSRLCSNGRRGQRYRNTLSKKSDADILLMCCYGEKPAWFIIPVCEILPRRYISVCSANPEKTKGQWKKYLENWSLLESYEF